MDAELVPLEDHDARDEAMFRAMMGGRTMRAIAKEFGVTYKAVERACLERLPTVDEASIRRMHREQIAYMQTLQQVFYRRAIEQEDYQAGLIALKCSERLGAMCGTDAPRPTQPLALTVRAEGGNSTERIRAVINRVIGDRTGPAVTNGPKPAPEDPDALPLPPRESVP